MNRLDPFHDLHPPRLPSGIASFGWPEALAVFGLGLLLAIAIFALLRPALERRMPPPTIEAELAHLRRLPPEERLLGQVKLLHRLGDAPPRDVTSALYGREATFPDLEPLIRRTRRGRRHA